MVLPENVENSVDSQTNERGSLEKSWSANVPGAEDKEKTAAVPGAQSRGRRARERLSPRKNRRNKGQRETKSDADGQHF